MSTVNIYIHTTSNPPPGKWQTEKLLKNGQVKMKWSNNLYCLLTFKVLCLRTIFFLDYNRCVVATFPKTTPKFVILWAHNNY